MKAKTASLLALLMFSPMLLAAPKAVIVTNLGEMTFELDDKTAPKTTAHFIRLANSGWYEGKTFYRVVKGHVAQAGINDDLHPDHKTYQVDGEFSEHKPQIRGSLGMARDEDPNSGSTEFYICLERRAHLDGKYTNFGQLVAGDVVLEQIAAVKVKEQWLDNPGGKPFAFHKPETAIVIQSIRIEP